MNKEIKNFADSRDLKSLKYIFVDCLDVDPTFVRYEEEYNYCRSIPGLLERHVELTPFTQDTSKWNEDYWTSLKMDLLKNFSEERMAHMREVARVFLADKVQRILEERGVGKTSAMTDKASEQTEAISGGTKRVFQEADSNSAAFHGTKPSGKAEQDRMILEAKQRLAQENRKIEQKRLADDRRIEQQSQLYQNGNQEAPEGHFSKKAIGIAIAAVVVIAVAVIAAIRFLK